MIKLYGKPIWCGNTPDRGWQPWKRSASKQQLSCLSWQLVSRTSEGSQEQVKLVKFISRLYKCLLWNLWPSKHGFRCHFYSCISEFKWYIARTFFSHNGGLICILNIRGTFFGNVNKQIQFLHIFPFPLIPIRKKNKGGARGHYIALHWFSE